jgi:type 1 glutamine amidotransferase
MHRFLCFTVVTVLTAVFVSGTSAEDRLKALIIDGQNNHTAWPKTTVMMKKYLEESGRFSVDVERTKYTWKGGDLLKQYPLDDGKSYEDLKQPKTDPDFKPNFSSYDVVLSNFGYNAADWPQETQQALVDFVSGGGGLVIIHAADNAWGDWKEFNEMIGLGGWGGRSEKTGPYVFIDESGKAVRDTSPGKGGSHGPQHEYQIVIRDPDHPITQGLPRAWMHAKDELYQQLRGPANHMTILATAFADKDFRGTGRHEPMIMTIDYDQGRVYHTPMGHADYSMQCVGFITTLVRGTEWAATGKVTVTDVPRDFPTATKSSERVFD